MANTTRADIEGGHEANYARFARRADRGECWEWEGPHDRYGYSDSAVRANGVRTRTTGHRIGYLLEFGHIPEGLVLDHLCRNRWCVNPWHLEAVTNQENLIRQRLSGVCRSGLHEMVSDNVAYRKDGTRFCAACRRASIRAYKARQKVSP